MLVHSRSLVYRHHAFWCWGTVAQGAVGSDFVVVVPPSFNQDLGCAGLMQPTKRGGTARMSLGSHCQAIALSDDYLLRLMLSRRF